MGKKIAGFIVLFFLLSIGFIFFKNSNRDKEELSIETPKIKNNPNLTRFYFWTKEDPLFTSPKFDAYEFENSIKALKSEENAFLSLVKKTNKLYPTKFLKDILLVDKLHNDFLLNPSEEKAKDLVNAYKKTQSDYETEVRAYQETIKIGIKNDSTYIGLNTSTTIDILSKDFGKLVQNASDLKKEIGLREQCLNKGIGCQRPAENFQKPLKEEAIYSFTKNDILPLNLLRLDSMGSPSASGPYIVSTNCFGFFGPKGAYYLMYLFKGHEKRTFFSYKEPLKIQNPKVATEIYYKKIKKGNQVDELLTKRGIERIRFYETNIYSCADSSYKATIATLDKFYDEYKNNLLFEKLLKSKDLGEEQKKIFTEGSNLEKDFFNLEFPSDASAQNIADYYSFIYKNISIWKKENQFQNTDWFQNALKIQDNFLERSLFYTRRLGNVEEIIADAIDHFSAFRTKSLIVGQDTSSYAYAFRNIYGLVYFPFSRSFYRNSDKLTLIEPNSRTKQVYDMITYHEALGSYKPEVIKKWEVSLNMYLEEDYRKFMENKLKKTPAADK